MDLLTALDELERDVTAKCELIGPITDYDPKEEMKKLRGLLEPFSKKWSILFFTKEQTKMLEEHFLKDPFPSHFTLLTLAFRLGLKERETCDTCSIGFLSSSGLNSPPPGAHTTSPHAPPRAHGSYFLPQKVPAPAAQEATEAPAFSARPVRTSRRVPRRVSQQQHFPRGPASWGYTARSQKQP